MLHKSITHILNYITIRSRNQSSRTVVGREHNLQRVTLKLQSVNPGVQGATSEPNPTKQRDSEKDRTPPTLLGDSLDDSSREQPAGDCEPRPNQGVGLGPGREWQRLDRGRGDDEVVVVMVERERKVEALVPDREHNVGVPEDALDVEFCR